MKYFMIIILYCLSLSAYSTELEMFSPMLLCKKSEVGSAYPYEYFARFYLKNTSNKNIKVMTAVKKSMFFKNNQNENELHFTSLKAVKVNNTPIIPSATELKIVNLRVGEAAFIETKFGSKKLIEEANFIYNINDDFDGRFGYWVGDVSLSNVKLTRPQYCKT
ncbi:hypothetical protein N8878_08365 [Psychromonas sp.]|nr:hypothetical protein [Psychromonas sp.]